MWTRLEGDKFKDALSERAKQWRVEEELRRKETFDSDRALDLKPAADDPLPSVTPTNAASQSHVDAKGEDLTGDLDAIDGTKPDADLEDRATGDAGTVFRSDRAPPSGSQGQNNAVNEELVKALAKANGTCNNSCNCIVA